jgi:hypothetical protein
MVTSKQTTKIATPSNETRFDSEDHQIQPSFSQTDGENVDELLHKAIEHNQVILLLAELMKQRAWEDNKNYIAAVKDLDNLIFQTKESSNLLQRARKKASVQNSSSSAR